MKMYLILFVFMIAFPIFSQDIETEQSYFQNPRDIRRQKLAKIKENETIKEVIRELSEEEEMYYRGRKKLKAGIIVFSAGCLYSAIPPLSMLASNDHDAYVGAMFAGLFLFWPVGAGAICTGIPLTISGAKQMSKYKKFKPTMAISPNTVRFAVEF